jgi:hypothetical protein
MLTNTFRSSSQLGNLVNALEENAFSKKIWTLLTTPGLSIESCLRELGLIAHDALAQKDIVLSEHDWDCYVILSSLALPTPKTPEDLYALLDHPIDPIKTSPLNNPAFFTVLKKPVPQQFGFIQYHFGYSTLEEFEAILSIPLPLLKLDRKGRTILELAIDDPSYPIKNRDACPRFESEVKTFVKKIKRLKAHGIDINTDHAEKSLLTAQLLDKLSTELEKLFLTHFGDPLLNTYVLNSIMKKVILLQALILLGAELPSECPKKLAFLVLDAYRKSQQDSATKNDYTPTCCFYLLRLFGLLVKHLNLLSEQPLCYYANLVAGPNPLDFISSHHLDEMLPYLADAADFNTEKYVPKLLDFFRDKHLTPSTTIQLVKYLYCHSPDFIIPLKVIEAAFQYDLVFAEWMLTVYQRDFAAKRHSDFPYAIQNIISYCASFNQLKFLYRLTEQGLFYQSQKEKPLGTGFIDKEGLVKSEDIEHAIKNLLGSYAYQRNPSLDTDMILLACSLNVSDWRGILRLLWRTIPSTPQTKVNMVKDISYAKREAAVLSHSLYWKGELQESKLSTAAP